jgi:hypothetical protein
LSTAASAELVLDQVIVDLETGQPARDDIEVHNSGEDRMYVLVEPAEILNAGLANELRVPLGPPSESGMFVSPQRIILEAGERRLVRIAATGGRPSSDRIFRVRIRPVVGEVVSQEDALKVLVGYDALVLYRATKKEGTLDIVRSERALSFVNRSNSATEVFGGQQCNADGDECHDLPGNRLYPGETWSIELPFETEVRLKQAIGSDVTSLEL